AAVVLARDTRELSQLARRQESVRNRDAQHRRIALDVEAVSQAQRAELILAQFAAQEALGLAAELPDPLVHQALVDLVVTVHGRTWQRTRGPYTCKDYRVRM